ncbi:MAG: FecCD family ABC transporter permease [Agrococcus casei]|nr:iron ABC transporter permease [Agrococcus casei]
MAVITLVSSSVGQFSATVDDVLGAFGRIIAPGQFATTDETARVDATLWNVRFPRMAMGLVVGAALGVAGALTQSLFGNPLAEPSVIGITSGASVGAAISIAIGASALGMLTTPAFAFAFGLATAILVWMLAQRIPAQRAVSLLLVGIAVNALAGAATAFIFMVAPTTARDAVVFWQLGSIAGSTWTSVGITAAFVLVGLIAAAPLIRPLDVLALGDRAAAHVGLRVPLVRIVTITVVALLTAAAVAFAGIIGFVGLIVPHAIRLIVGPSHRHVVPLSMLAGAALVTLADLGARTLVPLTDLPIGMLTSTLGAPLFLILLYRTFASNRGAMS